MPTEKKIRVLIAKTGTDGHTRGATVVATALRDAGMEVIIGGVYLTVEEILKMATEEDVDVIGLSILDGTHMPAFTRLATMLQERGMDDVLLVGGGIIPDDEIAELKKWGVHELFPPGTPTEQIVRYLKEHVTR